MEGIEWTLLFIQRLMLRVCKITAFAVLLVPALAAQERPSALDPKEVVRRAAEHDIENDQKQRNYTFIERVAEKTLGNNGDVKSSDVKTYEVMVLYGEQVKRLIARNDQRLSAQETAKEEDRINKLVERYKNESEGERRARLERYEKDRDEKRRFVTEITDAFDFKELPGEEVNGRANFVIAATPKSNYNAHSKEARFVTKFRFKVWIDKVEYQWSQVDAEAIDSMSWGVFLARMNKGTRVHLLQTRLNNEIWLPRVVNVRLDAKVVLFKNLNRDIDVSFRDYKRFGSETKITSSTEAPPPAQ